MTYILKNTAGLINTRVTDAGRQKISQGNFNISYFQIGDSEVSYNALPSSYNQSKSFVLEPPFNSQNISGVPQSNRQNVKYPYFVDGTEGNTYGIPFMDSGVDPVFNRAPLRGFFTGNTTASTISWSALTSNIYAVSANYVVDMTTLNGTNEINLNYTGCDYTNLNKPSVGDIITIFYDGIADYNCGCINLPPLTPTPTPTPSPVVDTCIIMTELDEFITTEDDDFLVWSDCDTTPTVTPTATPTPTPTPSFTPNYNPCASPTPTPTPTKTPCLTPTPSRACPPPPAGSCFMETFSCNSILTYRIIAVCENKITLDRPTPDFTSLANENCMARTIIYPPNMTSLYDSITPRPHWADDVINFESICDIDQFDVKIWNMNIPWTESPAGLNSTLFEDYTKFGSIDYIGTKEYFGYTSQKGQRDTSEVFYYNSFDEKIVVTPEEQKAIAIIHYTNQTIDFFYGEKFALEPYNPSNPEDTTGQARNFKLHIPWIMWHKNPECCFGQTFWVDPPGFDDKNLFEVHYLESTKNEGMNQPGIRYYHLWDTNPNANGLPSRVGKVFPDSKLVIIDDEEIIAAMSYKSNRNWTLTAPQVSLITPNTCGIPGTTNDGVLTGNGETMYITYRLSNSTTFTNSLHSNYYSKIVGNNNECNPNVSQNVAVRFGGEFNCLTQPNVPTTTTTTTIPITTTTTTMFFETCYILTQDLNVITTNSGDGLIWCNQAILNIPFTTENSNFASIEKIKTIYTTTTTTVCPTNCELPRGFLADTFQVLAQKVPTGQRPNPSLWKIIDYTYLIESQKVNGFITQESLTGTTFVVTKEEYESAPYYNLNDYIDLVPVGNTQPKLNFGDEYYFYGSLETDIQATIYEMRYKINLSAAEFQNTTNPTWTKGTKSYITEIALLDSNKDIMVMSKLQSPVLRQGIQQFVVKIDF
jgi:hypothetical protein